MLNLGIDVSANPSLISLNGIPQLNAIATGGVFPYTYLWSPTGSTIRRLPTR